MKTHQIRFCPLLNGTAGGSPDRLMPTGLVFGVGSEPVPISLYHAICLNRVESLSEVCI
jgi:hypothetical protein